MGKGSVLRYRGISLSNAIEVLGFISNCTAAFKLPREDPNNNFLKLFIGEIPRRKNIS